ncbi:MAG: ABC transporter ATP-binding protein [Candidatus Margulisbacteria bacterium]|nr:ABC transporter ATP-binding protein [Candidatus Margulisiibacteriota bacterium]
MVKQPLFQLRDVSYAYPGKQIALSHINLNIHQGEKLAVIGANGTGKSTLLSLLDGLIFPYEGSCAFLGSSLTEESLNKNPFEFRKKVGLVFQNADIQLFCSTVQEDIAFGPLNLGVDKKVVQERIRLLAKILDIEHLLHRVPFQLSIGEKRKVSIASVLAIEPDVLLLDEPTAGLDPHTVRHIIDLIHKANEQGKTIITATHDMQIVNEIADKVIVFGRNNSIIRNGPVEEILHDREFLENNNLVHIHKHISKGKPHIHPHEN